MQPANLFPKKKKKKTHVPTSVLGRLACASVFMSSLSHYKEEKKTSAFVVSGAHVVSPSWVRSCDTEVPFNQINAGLQVHAHVKTQLSL